MRASAYLGSVLTALTGIAINLSGIPILTTPLFLANIPKRGGMKRRNKTTLHPHNGKREVARRLRQIAAGQLTVSNGLVVSAERKAV